MSDLLCRSTILANDLVTDSPMRVQLRRYRNRRYYDPRSQHLTLEDIFQFDLPGTR